MKHYMLLCAVISLLFTSCGKEKRITPDDGGKKYPVKFDVSGFTQIYEPQGSATGKVKTNDVDSLPVTTLAYVVFKDNQIVSIKTSKKGEAGFGTFTDELSPGSYQIAFGGGSPGIISMGSVDVAYPDNKTALLSGNDLFSKKIPLTVSSSAIAQNVQLSRVSSQLVVNINDPVPTGVTFIGVRMKDTTTYALQQQKYYGEYDHDYQRKIIGSDIGKSNYRIVINNSHNIVPFTITIYYVQNGKTVSKVIPNVVCKTNMRTVLSGNLFGSNGANFEMKIDRNLNPPVYTDF